MSGRRSRPEAAARTTAELIGVHWVMVAILTLVGLALRLAYLLRVPPFLDEYSSMLTGMSILRTGGIPQLPSGVLYPSGSLFSYLEAAFIGLFGFSDLVARLPSLLLAGITLPLLYVVTSKLLNRRAALLSVALLALAPEAVVWGGRARMYALLQLLALLTVYFFYRYVLDPRPGEGGRSWLWIGFFVAAIFAQDEAILLLPIFWLAALVVRDPRWFLRWSVLPVQIVVPLAGVGARYWLNEIRVPGEVYTLTHDSFFRFPPALAHGLKKIAPFFTAPGAWPVALFFVVALVLLAGRARRARQGQEGGGTEPQAFASEWCDGPPVFLAYVVLSLAAAIVLVVNTPWQDDRYLFMVLPFLLMVAAWGMEQIVTLVGQRWAAFQSRWATLVLVVVVAGFGLPSGLGVLQRFEPDYSAAYRWLAPRLAAEDLVATVRPAPAAVYLGRCDFLVAEDKHQEFIMRLNGVWVDRWAGARVLESPEAFRDEALRSGRRVWFVIDEDRFESVAYSPEFVGLVVEQMDLVWHQGGVLVFEGQGYRPPPAMAVTHSLDANFGDQIRLAGYALSSDRPEPGQTVVLQLLWQAIRPERNYTVFVHVIGADGRGLTQLDGEPFLGLYGMSTHWPHDRVVVDERRLEIPADTPPGRYHLEIGLYDGDRPDSPPLKLVDTGEERLILGYLAVNVAPPPEPSEPVAEGTLGDLVRLLGYDASLPLQVKVGATLPLTLTWECLAPFDAGYTVFVHLDGADGRPVAQADGPPLGGTYPTQFWRAGERLADPHPLAVPADVPPGDYELRVGMYLLASGDRLPLLDADGQVVGDAIPLGEVKVVVP